jgi:hypothetical protein
MVLRHSRDAAWLDRGCVLLLHIRDDGNRPMQQPHHAELADVTLGAAVRAGPGEV